MKRGMSDAEAQAWAKACNSIQWACAGKHGFESRSLADKVARKTLRSKTKKPRGPLNVYRCDYCKKWHLGGST